MHILEAIRKVFSQEVAMQVTLKIEGFTGNSNFAGHSGEIEIASYDLTPISKSVDLFTLSFCLMPEEWVSRTHLIDVAQKGKDLTKANLYVTKNDLGVVSEILNIEMRNVKVKNEGLDQSGNNKFSFKSKEVLLKTSNNMPKAWDIKEAKSI